MNTDIRVWAPAACLACQQSKMSRRTITPPANFALPDTRFATILVDLVRHLPSFQGHLYLLTAIDRLIRWPEAVQVKEITVETVGSALLCTCIARFGVSAEIVTDRRKQFE